jgi:hypothetical protein
MGPSVYAKRFVLKALLIERLAGTAYLLASLRLLPFVYCLDLNNVLAPTRLPLRKLPFKVRRDTASHVHSWYLHEGRWVGACAST